MSSRGRQPGPQLDAAVQAALDAWATHVEPQVRKVSKAVREPGKVAEQARAVGRQTVSRARRSWRSAADALRDVASSATLGEALHKLRRIQREQADAAGAWVPAVSRALVCAFFINQVQESLDLHRYYAAQAANAPPRHKPHVPPYPWLQLLVVAPVALSCALGYHVILTSLLLTIDMLREEGRVLSSAILGWLIVGARPNELQMKKASVLGCIALVLTSALRDHRRGVGKHHADWVGLLDDSHAKLAGRRASLALLVGRLLLALMFIYVGTGQVGRIRHRAQLWSHRADPSDGHDNHWLLLQFALALPLAAGYKTRTMCGWLALACMAEALTCWRFWRFSEEALRRRSAWAIGKYVHARSHFATNLSVAGGLILLASAGLGRFTVDRLLQKKSQ